MSNDPKRVMADTLLEVLEGMAFTFADPPEENELPTGESEFFHATIEFRGPASGQLGIAVPASLCAQLTASVLGEEPGEVAVPLNFTDTLGELLNVTCGNFTTAMYGTDRLFDQSIPQVEKMNAQAWQALRGRPETIRFLVDDVPLMAHVSIGETH